MIEKTQLGHKKIVLKSLQTTTTQPAYKLTKIINVEFQCKHEYNLAKIIRRELAADAHKNMAKIQIIQFDESNKQHDEKSL